MSTAANVPKEAIQIVECTTPAQRREFIYFQWEIYKGDPYWVPPLISERVAFWDKRKEPFYEHSDAAMFLAKRNGIIVGTIAAIENRRHNQFHNESIGFFGGFECIDDQAVANKLFDTAKAWVQARGLNVLRGPATVSFNGEVGLLVDGWNGPPQPLTTYNPKYYVPLVENYGFKKAMDLWAWWNPITKDQIKVDEKVWRVAEIAKKRGKFTIRKSDIKNHLDREVAVIKKIYASNEGAWKENWGHVPMTDHELEHTVNGLKQFAEDDFIYIAEKDGEAIGFSITLPNVNIPLRLAYPKPGTPEFITVLKMLWHWKVKKTINSVRFMLLGVLPQYRSAGVDAALIVETLQTAINRGYIGGELGWILETNDEMNKINKLGGGYIHRTYRMYDYEIGD
jgi:GNAT superfamily N-acetyltransferase